MGIRKNLLVPPPVTRGLVLADLQDGNGPMLAMRRSGGVEVTGRFLPRLTVAALVALILGLAACGAVDAPAHAVMAVGITGAVMVTAGTMIVWWQNQTLLVRRHVFDEAVLVPSADPACIFAPHYESMLALTYSALTQPLITPQERASIIAKHDEVADQVRRTGVVTGSRTPAGPYAYPVVPPWRRDAV